MGGGELQGTNAATAAASLGDYRVSIAPAGPHLDTSTSAEHLLGTHCENGMSAQHCLGLTSMTVSPNAS